MEASKLYEYTFLQFEEQSLWGKIHYYNMRILLNPFDSYSKIKRIEALNKIVEINKKLIQCTNK